MHNLEIIIMAGGLGKRMKSDLPKVLHKVNGIPMLVRVIKEARQLDPNHIFIVVGKYKPIIISVLEKYIKLDDIQFINQEQSLGTGHAIQCCVSELEKLNDNPILILSGDTPLITSKTIKKIVEYQGDNKIMTSILTEPYGNGRIIRNINDEFEKIIEEKDCTEEEKKVKEVNCGTYVFKNKVLCKYLSYLDNNNAQNEYYITDLIKILKNNNQTIDIYILPIEKHYELTNVNTKEQLYKINFF